MKRKSSIDDFTDQNVRTVARLERTSNDSRTTGEWVADLVAATVGSWPFIIGQSVLLTIWLFLNIIGWFYHWDPYPFILLNLALSFQAAYASPIIMMSQNRQARIDQRRNKLDLQVNLLSEQENTEMLRLLRLLCEKQGIPVADSSSKVLGQKTSLERIIEQIEASSSERGE